MATISTATIPMNSQCYREIHKSRVFFSLTCLLCLFVQSSCAERMQKSPVHMTARDYFDDEAILQFCESVDRKDAGVATRLTHDSPEIHAVGKAGVTPLLWALMRHDLLTFVRLLELGADPNIPLSEDLHVGVHLRKGDCVTFLVFSVVSDEFYESVLEHGGNVKLVRPWHHDSLLHEAAIFDIPGQHRRITTLLIRGAELNSYNGSGMTPVMHAVRFGKFVAALTLLENGADYHLMQQEKPERLIHELIRIEMNHERSSQPFTPEFYALRDWLEAHGESMAAARLDVQRWEKMRATLPVAEYIAGRTKEREANLKNASAVESE